MQAVAEKKRHATVLQRAKPRLVKKSDKCFCHEAGADRSPYMACLSFHAVLPKAMPSFLKYSCGGPDEDILKDVHVKEGSGDVQE
eukprot:7953259-Alexandrium_andersonii.AAC.1